MEECEDDGEEGTAGARPCEVFPFLSRWLTDEGFDLVLPRGSPPVRVQFVETSLRLGFVVGEVCTGSVE